MPVTLEEKLRDRLNHAIRHREELDAIAGDMAIMLDIEPGSHAWRQMKAAAYGYITLNEAMQSLVNGKLAELAAIQIEDVK